MIEFSHTGDNYQVQYYRYIGRRLGLTDQPLRYHQTVSTDGQPSGVVRMIMSNGQLTPPVTVHELEDYRKQEELVESVPTKKRKRSKHKHAST